MGIEVKVPTLGESITEATLGAWLKQPGDAVAADEPIASLETDKVAVEVPAPAAGTMGAHVVNAGDTVAVGALIASIESGSGASATVSATPGAEAPPSPAAPHEDTNTTGHGGVALKGSEEHQAGEASAGGSAPAGNVISEDDLSQLGIPPSVRRMALERGLDPSKIRGSGENGELTKGDVLNAAAGIVAEAPRAPTQAAPASAAAPAGGRNEERVKMTRLRQTIAKRLKEAQNTAAMLTTFNDVDMTAVIDARARYKDLFEKKHGIRLGFMGFFTKAAVLALKDIPSANASIEGDEIVYRDYADISVAVSAPGGLVVPVIRDADKLSFADIEKTIAGFGKKAKAGTLTMDEMKGGTFTITNGGVFGSLMSTPIINPPQSAVLGMHRIEERPVVRDGQVVARPMMYLALSYDHRLIDGREAVTFLVRMKEAIEDPTRLLIDL
ncbi:MAG TPA: 2-oxoglutarate dehydrogenase complex dihydrolipoyllysine-residue succinyltransferase [Sphingomonadaceae bacterium]|nr:2-oxoglutarate dehydrogenase complex dihydrolipoyllysine-residue succinyltransferase [Sphingomonadaceae bacterium]